jgi:hypothetical protein
VHNQGIADDHRELGNVGSPMFHSDDAGQKLDAIGGDEMR